MPRGRPGIITVGDRREWPRECWGWKDWEDEERLQATLGRDLGASPVIPPPGPQPSFDPFPKPRGREARGARSRAVEKLIEKYVGR
jgi:hypothetical protein